MIDVAALLNIAIHKLVPSFFFFYLFKDNLAIPRKALYLMLALLIGMEYYLVNLAPQLFSSDPQLFSSDPQQFFLESQVAINFIYFCCCVPVVKLRKVKPLLYFVFILSIATMLKSLANAIVADYGISIHPATIHSLVLIAFTAFIYPIGPKLLEKYQQTFIATKVKYVLEVASIIMIFSLLANIYMYDIHTPDSWNLFWGRFFIAVPSILFISILIYLLKQQEENYSLRAQQQYLEQLRCIEKENFEYIYSTWQNSRRVRHDLRHIAVLFLDYLKQGQYDLIRAKLQEIKARTGQES